MLLRERKIRYVVFATSSCEKTSTGKDLHDVVNNCFNGFAVNDNCKHRSSESYNNTTAYDRCGTDASLRASHFNVYTATIHSAPFITIFEAISSSFSCTISCAITSAKEKFLRGIDTAFVAISYG